jgi:hypothetical protein
LGADRGFVFVNFIFFRGFTACEFFFYSEWAGFVEGDAGVAGWECESDAGGGKPRAERESDGG